jgi:hypothetical protein
VGAPPRGKASAMKPDGLTQKCGQPIGTRVKRREHRGLVAEWLRRGLQIRRRCNKINGHSEFDIAKALKWAILTPCF